MRRHGDGGGRGKRREEEEDGGKRNEEGWGKEWEEEEEEEEGGRGSDCAFTLQATCVTSDQQKNFRYFKTLFVREKEKGHQETECLGI